MYSVRIISGSRSFGRVFYIRCIAAVSRSIIRLAKKKKKKRKTKKKRALCRIVLSGGGVVIPVKNVISKILTICLQKISNLHLKTRGLIFRGKTKKHTKHPFSLQHFNSAKNTFLPHPQVLCLNATQKNIQH